MAILVMLVGVAGSGKSTYAQKIKNQHENAEIFSSDALRLELYGDENDQTHNKEVFEELHKRIHAHLAKDGVAIYDACNLTSKIRTGFLKTLKSSVRKVCHIIPATYDQAVARQELRERKVPAEVIHRQFCSFQTPYWHEGWDEIHLHTTAESRLNLYDMVEASVKIPHCNPHHKYTIGKHCFKAFQYAHDAGFSELIQDAALYHDIGKPFVKSFTNSRGEATDVAHYYSHQNYGAYLILLGGEDNFEVDISPLTLSFLVCYHMEEFIRKDKVDKFYNLVGPAATKQLKQLHECDVNAH